MRCKRGGVMYRHGVWSRATTLRLLWPHLCTCPPQPLSIHVYLVPLCNSKHMSKTPLP